MFSGCPSVNECVRASVSPLNTIPFKPVDSIRASPWGGLGWTCPPHFCQRLFLRLMQIRRVFTGGAVSGCATVVVQWGLQDYLGSSLLGSVESQ